MRVTKGFVGIRRQGRSLSRSAPSLRPPRASRRRNRAPGWHPGSRRPTLGSAAPQWSVHRAASLSSRSRRPSRDGVPQTLGGFGKGQPQGRFRAVKTPPHRRTRTGRPARPLRPGAGRSRPQETRGPSPGVFASSSQARRVRPTRTGAGAESAPGDGRRGERRAATVPPALPGDAFSPSRRSPPSTLSHRHRPKSVRDCNSGVRLR